MKAHYDAVVIGSGHNGLVAAAYLARAGKSVLVLEKNDYLGGATCSQRLFPDYDCQLSRYSYLVSLLPPLIVEELGLNFQTLRRDTASYTPYAGGQNGLLISNSSTQLSRDSMCALTGDDGEWRNYLRFQEMQVAFAEKVWPSLLQPLQSRGDFRGQLKSTIEKQAWDAFIEQPLGEVLERNIDNDLLRGLLMTDAKIGVFTHAHDPSLLQNRTFLYHVLGGGTGEWRVPVGGMGAFVTALLNCCEQSGVEWLASAEATAVHSSNGQSHIAFRHAGKEFEVSAEHLLVNAGPQTFATLFGDRFSPNQADEGSVVKVNLLLHRLPALKRADVSPQQVFCGSLHIDEGYEQMEAAYQQASKGALPDAAPCETYCHTLTDASILSPELRDAGYHTLTLFGLDMPYRLFEQDHDARLALVLKKYLRALDEMCAEPFADCIARSTGGELCIEAHSPQDLERTLGLSKGNIFHTAPSWFFTDDQAQVGSWGVETDYSNVYLAGSSAQRGGAVSGIPGRNAAQCILAKA